MQSREDWSLQKLIDFVHSKTEVDHHAGVEDPFSLATFIAALEEEVQRNRKKSRLMRTFM